ncbi:hypothetical protein McpAg1_08430 [Methanocorpusculaceae archaeon Ag1]|uniref:Uncharacterized protein n=1 Tax=Methanorbis furvi TaxID=3028299 RepID=A0AAE4SBK3_9EURY|nr:hypothetical protein [Methanocorpusculaceae archaeon Ag1]
MYCSAHGKTEYTEISRKKYHGADVNITEIFLIPRIKYSHYEKIVFKFCDVHVCSVMFFFSVIPCVLFFRGRLRDSEARTPKNPWTRETQNQSQN